MEEFRVPGPGIVEIDFSFLKGLSLTFNFTPIPIEEIHQVRCKGCWTNVRFAVLCSGYVKADCDLFGNISCVFIPEQQRSCDNGEKQKTKSDEYVYKTPESLSNRNDNPTTLVLFVKADSKSLIDTIKQKKALYEGAESTLFIDAFKMWVGTEEQYKRVNVIDEFKRDESKDSFVKEYDYVAMRFQLNKAYKGYRKGEDSYERNQFFTDICKDKVQLLECSKRLSFDENTKTDAYDVY